MDLFFITFRIFILTPIRIMIDLIKWLITFIREIFKYKLVIVFFLFFVGIMWVMILFPDGVVLKMVQLWGFNRNFFAYLGFDPGYPCNPINDC